jgi:signal transducing adaptor molecule
MVFFFTLSLGPVLARVEYDYEAKESGELSLEVGRVVTILDSSDPAWWTGDLNGKVGTFPSNVSHYSLFCSPPCMRY